MSAPCIVGDGGKLSSGWGSKAPAVHLDITSFHVDGAYDCADGDLVASRDNWCVVYGRDHRPELNQK